MKSKKKLLIIDLGKSYGGMEKLIENLILGFKDEFEITLAVNTNGSFLNKTKVLNQCKIIKFDNNIKNFINTILNIKKYVKEERIEIIHCNGTPSNIIGIILKKILGIKFISTVHSDILYEFKGKKRQVYLNVERLTAKYSDYVVAVSKDLEKKLKCRHSKYSNKFITIYNGIYSDVISSIENKDSDELKILFVGRLTEIKNIPYLLRNLKKLKDVGKRFTCNIIGEGELEEDLKQFCNENDLSQYVNFLGYRDNINYYMRKSDLLIMTSNMEGIPLVILEAFSNNLPVISSKVGGVVEMIDNGVNGILYDLNEEFILSEILIDIMENKYNLDEIRNYAFKEYMNKWTREVMLDKYKKLYLG